MVKKRKKVIKQAKPAVKKVITELPIPGYARILTVLQNDYKNTRAHTITSIMKTTGLKQHSYTARVVKHLEKLGLIKSEKVSKYRYIRITDTGRSRIALTPLTRLPLDHEAK
jgi:predicted transcriptional regulator